MGYYFYPDGRIGAKRFNLFSHYFSKKTKVIDILTIKEDYIKEKDRTIVHSGNIYRTGFYPRHGYNGNVFLKIFNKIFMRIAPIEYNSAWILPLVIKGFSIIKKDRIDTIIATGPPFSPFVAAFILSKIFKADLVIDYQDPWFFDEDNGGRKLNMFLEKRIMKRASKIIFNTDRTKEEYLKLKLDFNIADKSYVINNPYYQKENAEPLYLEKNKKVIIYAGNFYGRRRLKYIFKPLLKLYPDGKLKDEIALHVFGPIHEEDAQLIKELDLSDVVVEHERIEYSKLIRYMKGSDILYLSQGEDHGYSVPYKLIDYMTISRPVLAVTSINSSTYNFMQGLDCGLAADIDDPESIYLALKELLMNNRGFSYNGIEKYSYENLGEQFLNLLTNTN